MGVDLTKHHIIILGILVLFLSSQQFVAAHDGGHTGCFLNGCPIGHFTSQPYPNNCPWTDPACGPNPVDGCDIRTSTTFNPVAHNLPAGIDVCANSIVLDCNGATLRGSSGSDGVRARTSNTDVTIKNCNVVNYGSGISFAWASNIFYNNKVFNNNVANSLYAGIHIEGNDNTILNNNVNSNSWGGIDINGNNNTVSNNRANYNAATANMAAITVYGNLNSITNNSADSNRFAGFIVNGNFNIISNNAISNSWYGVICFVCNNNTIFKNNVYSSGYDGITLTDSSYNLVKNNSLNSNSGGGILIGSTQMSYSHDNTVLYNTIHNSSTGIGLWQSSSNTILGNVADSNYYGITLTDSNNNRVINNSATSNNNVGILISGSNNERVDWNYVCSNGVLDFNVSNSIGNSGTNNRCNRPDNWSDSGSFGCTFRCPIAGFPAGSLDYGDAPDPPYQSLFRSNGARHSDIGYEMLGTRVSADLDAKVPNLDEFDDGVTFPVLRPFSPVNLNVTVTVFDKNSPWYQNPLFLSGWFDWNNDGSWSANEKAFGLRLNASTFQNNTIIIPVTFMTPQINGNTTWARIRLSYRTEANVTGEVLYGEVEDYIVNVSTAPLLTIQGLPRIGTTMNLSIDDSLHPSASYVLGISLGTVPGIRLSDGRVIPLNFDILLLPSLQIPQAVGLSNNIGTFNSQGKAVATWSIPNVPGLVGNTFYFAFVTLVQTGQPIASISRSVNVTVVP